MVSVYLNPSPSQDFTQFYSSYNGGDPMKTGINAHLLEPLSSWNTSTGMEDPSKKTRKPYTITKSRESWSEQEHDKFLEALQLFDRDWKKIEAFVGSKTVIQIRSHAQKYFLKVLKNGKSEHVPPPRPKRKATHPYPQKAPKNAVSPATGVLQSSPALLDSMSGGRPNSLSVNSNPVVHVHLSHWMTTGHSSRDDIGLASGTMIQECSSFNDETSRLSEKQCNGARVMPDFAQVYDFIGSVFDHSSSDHLQRLKKMDPENFGTVLTLMKNLSINLVIPEFLDYRKLLSSYQVSTEPHTMGNTIGLAQLS